MPNIVHCLAQGVGKAGSALRIVLKQVVRHAP